MKVLKTYKVTVFDTPIKVEIKDEEGFVMTYNVEFSDISKPTSIVLETIKDGILKDVRINPQDIFDPKVMKQLSKDFTRRSQVLISKKLPHLKGNTKSVLVCHLLCDMIGLGSLEIPLNDPDLEEVVVNTSGEPAWVFHKEYGWLKTNIKIPSEQHVQNYASTIARRVGRQITTLEPLLDAHMTSGDRANATLFPISTKGNTITIRKFARKPWTITDFISNETLTPEVAAFIWLAMQYELNIIVAGGTSSGKCISGNSKILLPDGRTDDIKSIVEKEFKKRPPIKTDDGWLLTDTNMEVFSFDSDQKIKPMKISKVWKRRAPESLYEIRTHIGRKIKVTPEHPFICLKNGDITKIRADELKTNDFICLPRKIDYDGAVVDVSGDILPFIKKFNYTFDDLHEKFIIHVPRGKDIAVPKKASGEIMEFIGYILADGHIGRKNECIKFFNSSESLLKRFIYLAKRLFGVESNVTVYSNKTPYAMINSVALCNFLSEVFKIPRGRKAGIIALPDFVFKLPRGMVSPVIRSLFDCEGYVATDRSEIEFTSKSEKIVEQLGTMLKRFGIVTRKRCKYVGGQPYFNLYISDSTNLKIFMKEIGFLLDYKKTRLEAAIKNPSTNFDVIPGTAAKIKKLKKKLMLFDFEIGNCSGLSTRIINRYLNSERNPTRQSLLRLTAAFERRQNEIRECYDSLIKLEKEVGKIPDSEEIFELSKKIAEKLKLDIRRISKESGIGNSTFWLWKNGVMPSLGKVSSFGTSVGRAAKYYQNQLYGAGTINDLLDAGITKKQMADAFGMDEFAFYHSFRNNRIEGLDKKTELFKRESIKTMKASLNDMKRLQNLLENSRHNDFGRVFCEIKKHRKTLKISSIAMRKELGFDTIPYENTPGLSTAPGRVLNIIKFLEQTCEEALGDDVGKEIEKLKRLATSDVLWDRPVKITKVRPKEKWVYDLTVENTHNFVADGVVVSNTALLNSLMPFIQPNHRVISIEDTRELRLPNFLHWVPLTTRLPNPEGKGEVSMLDLMVNSLRMRPDRIVVGEIRREDQAEVLFEAMHTGHSVYATLHADTAEQVIRRMTNPPINISNVMMEALHLIVVQHRDRRRGVRRTYQVAELMPAGEVEKRKAKLNVLYRLRPDGKIVAHGTCVRIVDTIRMYTGMSNKEFAENLREKIFVLEYLVKKKINDVDGVGKIIAEYYRDKDALLKRIM